MQSGISASKELHDAFQKLSSSTSERGLIAGIEKEQLMPIKTLPLSSPDFLNDLGPLQESLTSNAAAYVILRRYTDAPDGFVAVTYVPDTAPVRQKMLFASTRLTLVRELGTEKFRDTLFATTKDELTADGWRKHDRHGQLKAPLTQEEETLQSVKDAESEASRSTGERRQQIHSSGLQSPVSTEGIAALKALPQGSDNLVQMRMNVGTEAIELVSSSRADINGLATAISATEPRYSFFRYEHDHDGQSLSPVIFISTCPDGLKVKERMLHAASRALFAKSAPQQAGISVEKRLEVSDPSEITSAAIHEEFHPKTQEKQGFSRPKRPGRK